MDPTLGLLLLIAAGGVIVVVVLVKVVRDLAALNRPPAEPAALLVLQNQIESLREQVRASLEGGRIELDRRLADTQRVVGEVQRGLGEVDRHVQSVSEAARDLRGLQELLRSPKIRGGIGEHLLGELLAQTLPRASFELQYEFPGGERVDAILKIGEGLVPVDAKFPLENFRRQRRAAEAEDDAGRRGARRMFRADIRRHVDAIAGRYIRPGDGTYDFAMMYLPAEAVYQALLFQDTGDGMDLLHYALSRRVVPVSPQSFYAYLQVIVLGLRGLTIERRAREIMDRLGGIRSGLSHFGESFEVAARHLSNAQRQTEEAARRLARLDAAIANLAEGGVADAESSDVTSETTRR
jgi:DNA recombination protein RmuC